MMELVGDTILEKERSIDLQEIKTRYYEQKRREQMQRESAKTDIKARSQVAQDPKSQASLGMSA